MVRVFDFLVTIAFGIIITLEGAWILEDAWAWFIVPKFGQPVYSYGTMLSALLFVHAVMAVILLRSEMSKIVKKRDINSKSAGEDLFDTVVSGFLTCALGLPLAWVSLWVWHIWV